MYICVYIYIHTYIHIYIYTYISGTDKSCADANTVTQCKTLQQRDRLYVLMQTLQSAATHCNRLTDMPVLMQKLQHTAIERQANLVLICRYLQQSHA